MAASKKAIENAQRLRYMRALERFHKSIISYLSNNNEVTKEGYEKKCLNAKKLLDRVEPIALYKGDLQELEALIKKMLSYVESDTEIEDIQQDIVYCSNQLDKTKNSRKYKKDKHQSSKYKDWE